MSRRSAIVIGAGIVGLATARALAVLGYQVKVIERNTKAIGASIRNFGMIWPIGQPDGDLYERAMLSRQIWKEVCDSAGIWYDEAGSLHTAHNKNEAVVLEELADIYRHRDYKFLNSEETIKRSVGVVAENLEAGLSSPDEMIIEFSSPPAFGEIVTSIRLKFCEPNPTSNEPANKLSNPSNKDPSGLKIKP